MHEIQDEGIKHPQKYIDAATLTKDECRQAIASALEKIDGNLSAFTDRFPSAASEGGIYRATENTDWTSSFWTGMLWLAYELTGRAAYRQTAETQLQSFKERIEGRINTDTHDLGFLYTLSCVAAYKLTGNEAAKATALRAADLLMERYLPKAGILQAWGDPNDPNEQGRMIIDCCMNLPLLYWASETAGEPRYRDAAYAHIRQAARYLIRDDASSFHTFYMDVATGQPKYGTTHQGYSDTSCWARGQAWAIYGFALSYRYTGDPELLEAAQKVSNYFLNRLPEDDVCCWDLVFTEGKEPRDSSAAAIAACGLLEIARRLPITEPYKPLYEKAASRILRSLMNDYVTGTDSNGLLRHAVYSMPHHRGVDECCIWGDYFYCEALARAARDWQPYW